MRPSRPAFRMCESSADEVADIVVSDLSMLRNGQRDAI
jgi:hypothetical protein